MRSWIATLLVVFQFVAGNCQTSDLQSLVDTLKKTARPGAGITDEEQEMAKKVQHIGAGAIPYLLLLLRDKNEDVRDLAAYTLPLRWAYGLAGCFFTQRKPIWPWRSLAKQMSV